MYAPYISCESVAMFVTYFLVSECESLQVSGTILHATNGQYGATSIKCNKKPTFRRGKENYFIQYTSNSYWVISTGSCTAEGYNRALARVRDSAPSPELVDIKWQEKNGIDWVNSPSLRLICQGMTTHLTLTNCINLPFKPSYISCF